jgi:hypothetical protein
MVATFPFYLHAMLEWYHTHLRKSSVFEFAHNRMVHTHIYESDRYEPLNKKNRMRVAARLAKPDTSKNSTEDAKETDSMDTASSTHTGSTNSTNGSNSSNSLPSAHHTTRPLHPKGPFLMQHITDVACFLPHPACLPFLPSRRRYPLGLYAVSDPKAGALFVVYPKVKSNRKKERAVFADHFSFVYDDAKKSTRVINLHQTEYVPTQNDIFLGFIDHTFRPLKEGTQLPREGYATKAFSKFTKFERDLLDICRLPLCAPTRMEGGGRGARRAASSKPSKKKKLVEKLLKRAMARRPVPQEQEQEQEPPRARRRSVRHRPTPVSARLTRLLLRHSVRDIRLFGVAVPADAATTGGHRPLTWHYTCFLQVSDDNDPALGVHDLSFQVPDPSWRSAQHALIRRIKQMERNPMAPAPEPSWLAE